MAWSVVVICELPLQVAMVAVTGQFKLSCARGKTVPFADVFFIHNVKLTVAFAAIVPPTFGTPGSVRKVRR
jgi:hypothetical protein